MAAPTPSAKAHAAHALADGGYTSNILTLDNESGSVQLSICATCSFIEADCSCSKNSWFDAAGKPTALGEGVTLLCDLCGADGT